MSIQKVLAALQEGIWERTGAIIYIKNCGFLIGWGEALPTSTKWAKGAIFIRINAAADSNLYINEAASGEGTAPSWVAQTT